MKNDQLEKQEEALAHILDDTADATISIAKLYYLSDLPHDLMDRFVSVWPAIPPVRRQKIARHLADIMEENYQVDFSPLFAYFLQDPHAEVRRAAFDGLWDSSDTSLIPTLIALMQNDAEESVRIAAASTLGHYVLMAQWGEIDPAADKPIVPVLLAELDKDDVSLPMRRAALESVAASGHGRVPDLIQAAYASNRYELRLSAVYAMGYSADRRWLSTVLLELDHDEPDMRIEAARAAGLLSASDAIEKLAELIEEDDDLEVQIAAVQALGQIGGDRATELLQEFGEVEDFPEELLTAIDDALEEVMWLGSDFDFHLLDLDDEDLDADDGLLLED